MSTSYISTPEWIWIVTVTLGVLLNAIFVLHSIRLNRTVIRMDAPPSILEAARMWGFVDAAFLWCQLLFVPPGVIAARHPSGPITLEGWIFTLCFIGVEVTLVVVAAVRASWVRRIVRFRMVEGEWK